MKSTQSHLSYLIFGLLFLMSLQGWASFVQGTHVLTQMTCNGQTGTIKLVLASQSGEGGTPPFTYTWYQNTGSGWAVYLPTSASTALTHTITNVPKG